MGFSRQEYWSGLTFPSPVDRILSDLSTMTRPFWVAPRAWLSFIELDKAVVLLWLDWLVFCEYGFSVSAQGVRQGCILSPCLFNFYAEYIMRNAGLEETQAGIKIAGRNINNLTYADDTTLMAESQEELKSLLMKVKVESENFSLKLNIQKTKIMASSPITS